ncbi:hypothetical protein J6590_005565 [Homalodisca vitripennis]|nr:hypothetical protein J6590_005565 [Homalodisca vitripennis]
MASCFNLRQSCYTDQDVIRDSSDVILDSSVRGLTIVLHRPGCHTGQLITRTDNRVTLTRMSYWTAQYEDRQSCYTDQDVILDSSVRGLTIVLHRPGCHTGQLSTRIDNRVTQTRMSYWTAQYED